MTAERAPAAPPASSLVAMVESVIGRVVEWRDASWDHAESEVWEARSESGTRAFLKCHRQAAKFRQERAAYERWAPSVHGSPKLLAVREREPRALVLEAIPGEPLLSLWLPPAEEVEHYRQAGHWLRQLHDLPWVDEDELSIPDALARRSATWSERARNVLDQNVIEEIHARVTAPWPAAMPIPRRVPCHRDFTARNWVVSGTALHVIDFEHARPDWSFVDIERVRSSTPPDREDLWLAFQVGYDLQLGEPERELLVRLELHAALSQVAWAVEHNDAAFERSGRARIAARLSQS